MPDGNIPEQKIRTGPDAPDSPDSGHNDSCHFSQFFCAIYYIGPKRSRRMKNVVVPSVLEYLSG